MKAFLAAIICALAFAIGLDATAAPTVAWTTGANGSAADDAAWCPDYGTSRRAQAVDAAGNVFVTGCADNSLSQSLLLYKLSGSTGALLWSASAFEYDRGAEPPQIADAAGVALALDASGNVVVTGGAGNIIFTAKYAAADGALLWKAMAGEESISALGQAVAIDGAGNVLVTGHELMGDFTTRRIRTLKYHGATGEPLWSVAFEGDGEGAQGFAVAADAGGAVYVTGTSRVNDVTGHYDTIRTIKYSAEGDELWSVATGQDVDRLDRARGDAIAVDAAGVYVAGTTPVTGGMAMATAMLDPETGAQVWLSTVVGTNAGANDLVLGTGGALFVTGFSWQSDTQTAHTLRYDAATGAEQWSALLPGITRSLSSTIALDPSGNVVVAGTTVTPSTYIQVAKFQASDGDLLWSFEDEEENVDQYGVAVGTDASGNVIATGIATTDCGCATIRTLKLDAADGTPQWTAGQPGVPAFVEVAGEPWSAKAMAVDAAGNVFMTGGSLGMRTVKLDGATGVELWNVAFGDRFACSCSMAVDAAGNVFVTGSDDFSMRTLKLDGATGALLWSATFAGSGFGTGEAIAVDAAGNVAVTGTSGDELRTIKYHGASGAELWNRSRSSPLGSEGGNAVAFDAAGNVFITGYGVVLGPGQDILTIKYNGVTGAEIWSATYNGTFGTDFGNALAVDAAGDVIVTGQSFNSPEATNFRTIKYNGATGAEIWNAGYNGGGNLHDFGYGIALDAAGNAVVTGSSVDEDGTDNIRTIKYDGATGTMLWTAAYAGADNGEDAGHAVVIDAAGNVLVTGLSTDVAGAHSIRAIKYSGADGAQIWTHSAAGTAAIDAHGYAIATGPGNAVYVFGTSVESLRPDGFFVRKLIDPPSFTVTPSAGARGTISPATPQSVEQGQSAQFTVTANVGWFATVEGTCGGSLEGTTYTTNPIVAHCTVAATFQKLPPGIPGDFNDDDRADLLWVNTDGRAAIWLMNGTTFVDGGEIIGAATGWFPGRLADFDADRNMDILWQQADGRLAIFLMDGAGVKAAAQILNAGPWRPVATPDLNGDGRADILFHNEDDDSAAAWLMEGTTVIGGGGVLGAGTGWSFVRSGDFDGDGDDDLLWRHTDGRVALWLMDGIAVTGGGTILADVSWTVAGIGDLDGDGKADIVWAKDDGTIAVWLMNGAAVTGSGTVLGAGNPWTVRRTGDFDGDGKVDLLFVHPDGRAAIYLMEGAAVKSTGQILNAGTGWSATRVQDMNGDAKADIVWSNADGRTAVWLMNGTAPLQTRGLGLNPGWSVLPDVPPTAPD